MSFTPYQNGKQMSKYIFVIRYRLNIEADSEDEAYDEAYSCQPMDAYHYEATLVRS